MNERQAHWLRTNRASRVPRRVVCLDSEAVKKRRRQQEVQTFRLAALSFDLLDVNGNTAATTKYHDCFDTFTLWQTITGHTAQSHKTVLFAPRSAAVSITVSSSGICAVAPSPFP